MDFDVHENDCPHKFNEAISDENKLNLFHPKYSCDLAGSDSYFF